MGLVTLKNKAIIKGVRPIVNNNLSLLYTTTSANQINILTNRIIASSFGSLLHSLSYTYALGAQSNFQIYITGINVNAWNVLPATALAFEVVPEGAAIFLPPNTEIKIYSQMTGSATANQSFSVTAILEDLTTADQLAVEQ